MTEATPEMKMARRIAAHTLCGPEKWKPGVKAGIYEEIMRGEADAEALVQGPLAAIIETQLLIRDWLTARQPTGVNDRDFEIANAIRAGHHYGKDSQ